MNRAEVEEIILKGEVLSPTLSDELIKALGSLSPEALEQLGELIKRAGEADKAFGRVSSEYIACIQEIEERALRRLVDEERRIMEQFERELLLIGEGVGGD